jgi:N4-gp56 family major capsid protein
MKYNNPAGGTASSIGPQHITEYHIKKSLIEARQEQYFSQLADVTHMPKNFGKKITCYHYLPLLDDRNINDQGIDAAGATIADGNLYGSSKDIGTITGKLPTLGEDGGRVNRVGFTRLEIEGTFTKFGFFTEITQDAKDFDADPELWTHISTELIKGATEISEDLLQKDLLLGAGVVVYAGAAVSNATISGETGDECVVTYEDLMNLSITLDNNRTPKQTKVITGSRMIDTKTISSGRVMFIGSELLPTLRSMKDLFNNEAWIPVHKYADAGTILVGEAGCIDMFRFVVVPEMMYWAGVGATVTVDNAGYRFTGTKYDVYPMLSVGDKAFTSIGFQTDGKQVKFKIITKMPGDETADRNDPYGETGFSSIKWFHGTLIQRAERIALLKTAAKM